MKKANAVLPNINWKKKFNGRGITNSNHVTVNLIKGEGKCPKRLSITFRDNMYKNFEGKYLCLGVLKNRMYFRPTDNKSEGYVISIKGLRAYVVAGLSKEEIAEYEPFVGSYTLRFDDFYELYYIDIEREAFDTEAFANLD